MRFMLLGLCLFATACGGGTTQPTAPAEDARAKRLIAAETVVIGTSDGQKIFADHVPVEQARATIVLFHQAESSSYEYRGIAEKLNEAGYSTLAVDQRSGGDLYGPNRTVRKYQKSAAYLEALPDMDAALNWARLQGPPVILLGSSYSAALSFILAADNPERVAAVLAFSPGEYFDDPALVRQAAARVHTPVLITQAKTSEEVAQSQAIFDALPGPDKTLFIPQAGGVHGASTLRPDRNPAGVAENWQAVTAFLDRLVLRPNG